MADFDFGLLSDELVAPEEQPEGVYEPIADHEAAAVDILIPFFRQGPRNCEVLAAMSEQVQEAEDAVAAMFDAFDLNTATGDRLDLIGALLGETRGNKDDEAYRAILRAIVLVNRSTGRRDALYDIMRAIDPASNPLVRDVYPAALELTMASTGGADTADVAALLRRAKAGGVWMDFVLGSPVDSDAVVGDVDGDPEGFIISSVF